MSNPIDPVGFLVKLKLMLVATFVLLGSLALFVGCSKGPRPLSPASGSFLSIKIPMKDSKGKALVASQYTFLYNITGPGTAPVTGSVGPISASTVTNTYSFTVNLVPANYNFIAMQINDSSNQQVLAVGAEAFVFVAGADVPVTLGPIKACYQVATLGSG